MSKTLEGFTEKEQAIYQAGFKDGVDSVKTMVNLLPSDFSPTTFQLDPVVTKAELGSTDDQKRIIINSGFTQHQIFLRLSKDHFTSRAIEDLSALNEFIRLVRIIRGFDGSDFSKYATSKGFDTDSRYLERVEQGDFSLGIKSTEMIFEWLDLDRTHVLIYTKHMQDILNLLNDNVPNFNFNIPASIYQNLELVKIPLFNLLVKLRIFSSRGVLQFDKVALTRKP